MQCRLLFAEQQQGHHLEMRSRQEVRSALHRQPAGRRMQLSGSAYSSGNPALRKASTYKATISGASMGAKNSV